MLLWAIVDKKLETTPLTGFRTLSGVKFTANALQYWPRACFFQSRELVSRPGSVFRRPGQNMDVPGVRKPSRWPGTFLLRVSAYFIISNRGKQKFIRYAESSP